MEQAIDRLKNLFNVNTDSALADMLELTRQSVSAARKRGKPSRNMIKAAGLKLGIEEKDLYRRLYGQPPEEIGITLIKQLSTHINRLAIEIGKMREKNERLSAENSQLRQELRSIAPETERNIPHMDEMSLFERLDTDDMAYIIETIGHVETFALYNMLAGCDQSESREARQEELLKSREETLNAISKACQYVCREQIRAGILPACTDPLQRMR